MRIAVLLPGMMWAFDVISIIQIFDDDSVNRNGLEPPVIDFIASSERQSLDHGLSIAATPLDGYRGTPDLIIIPGFANPREIAHDRRQGDEKASLFTSDPADALAIRDWLIKQHQAGAEIAAMCTGVFALAWSGLLDGVECTTHLPYLNDLSVQFPKTVVMHDRLLTHDARRRIWTSAGGSICLDLCLALMAEHEGQAQASAEADILTMRYPHSTGSRRPLERTAPPTGASPSQQRDDIIALTCRVREHLGHDWTLDALARSVHMSHRSFQRRFLEVVGMPPSSWLLSERLGAAKEMLELTDLPVQQVAVRTGLRNADLLRKHFTAMFGLSPSRYRKRFQNLGRTQ